MQLYRWKIRRTILFDHDHHIFIQLQSMRYYKYAITIYYSVWTRLTRVGRFEWLALS